MFPLSNSGDLLERSRVSLGTRNVPKTTSTLIEHKTHVRTAWTTVTTHYTLSFSTSCTDERAHGCARTPQTTAATASHSPNASATGSSASNSRGADLPSATSSTSSTIDAHTGISKGQKDAIIGGLAGAIAGLLILGALLAFFLRRRQKRKDQGPDWNEKGHANPSSNGWSRLQRERPLPLPSPPLSRQSSAANVNGNVIQMSLGGFARPFAHHKSWRESLGAARLMVTNPDDASGAATPAPRASAESRHSTFQHHYQRSSLSAIFLARSGSRSSSHRPSHDTIRPAPTSVIDPGSAPAPITYPARSVSLRSHTHTSIPATRAIPPRVPQDPFLTPPDERLEEAAVPSTSRFQRPSMTVFHSAANTATRTISSLSQALNPFRSRGEMFTVSSDDDDPGSRQSTQTFSSNGDPFQLDRYSSVRAEWMPGRAMRAYLPFRRPYEGT